MQTLRLLPVREPRHEDHEKESTPPPLAGGGRGRGRLPQSMRRRDRAAFAENLTRDSLPDLARVTPPPTPSRKGRGLRNVAATLLLPLLTAAFLAWTAPGASAAVTIERVVSPGGIVAWLVEDHSIPLIAIHVAFRGGTAADPVGKNGLATLVSCLLDEGAGDLDSQSYQRKLADLSIDLKFDARLDDFRGSMRTLTQHRDEAFDLLLGGAPALVITERDQPVGMITKLDLLEFVSQHNRRRHPHR